MQRCMWMYVCVCVCVCVFAWESADLENAESLWPRLLLSTFEGCNFHLTVLYRSVLWGNGGWMH